MDHVVIYTDGGCEPNPGTGGWGAVLACKGKVRELYGGEPETTNNRMEMTAAIRALEALKRPCNVELHTDSQYLRNGITSWMAKWKQNGWRTRGKPVKNQDLWQRLDELAANHHVKWMWVKGHAGNAMNERCDELAARGIREVCD